jgi:hypothetical protein
MWQHLWKYLLAPVAAQVSVLLPGAQFYFLETLYHFISPEK